MLAGDRPTATRPGPVRTGDTRPSVSGKPPGRRCRACRGTGASSPPAVQGLLGARGLHQTCDPCVGFCPSAGCDLRRTGMRGPSWGTPAWPSDARRSGPGPERDRPPLGVLPAQPLPTHQAVVRPQQRALLAGVVAVPHTRLSPLLLACLPPGCPGLSWGGRPGPPLLRRPLHPLGCAVPSGLHAGGRDPVHAPSPTGRVPRAQRGAGACPRSHSQLVAE